LGSSTKEVSVGHPEGLRISPSVVSAAAVLDLGVRQTFRLTSRYEAGAAGALIHQARGRASNRQLSAGIREYAVELVRTKYADFGPTLATEILQEKHSRAPWTPSTQRRTATAPLTSSSPTPSTTPPALPSSRLSVRFIALNMFKSL
jgi:hypothetical protein